MRAWCVCVCIPCTCMCVWLSKGLFLGASVDIGTDLAPAPLPPASVPIWRAFVAGGFGGVVSRTATAPLEKVKILQQVYTYYIFYPHEC